MNEIRVSSFELRADAETLRSYGSQVTTINSDMETTINSLKNNNYMDGDSAQAYIDQYTTNIKPLLDKLATMFNNFGDSIDSVVDQIEDADRQLAAALFSN